MKLKELTRRLDKEFAVPSSSEDLTQWAVTDHNRDLIDPYFLQGRTGLQAMRRDQIEKLLHRGHSIYVAHAPLDTHPVYSTSLVLAETLGITISERFYDYFGAPAALAGVSNNRDFKNFSEFVREKIKRPKVDTVQYRPHIEKIAVVAGGGDITDLL